MGATVSALRFSLFQHGQQPVRGLGYSAAIPSNSTLISVRPLSFLSNATLRGRAWYTLLDAPVLTLDVTV